MQMVQKLHGTVQHLQIRQVRHTASNRYTEFQMQWFQRLEAVRQRRQSQMEH